MIIHAALLTKTIIEKYINSALYFDRGISNLNGMILRTDIL